jgi:solute carrier family 4 (anion exchanger), member 1
MLACWHEPRPLHCCVSADITCARVNVQIIGAISAIPIVMFFYFDQNLSSLLTQQPYMRLRFGSFYHSSFLAMGVFNFIGPSFGLPFVTGSLPHSPQLVKALTNYRRNPDGTFTAASVSENRIAPLLMYLLIGLPVVAPNALKQLPKVSGLECSFRKASLLLFQSD